MGGIYIHQRHAANKDLPRFAGWWGYDKDRRFQMEKGFQPIPTAEGWQLSNAPIFSMAAHKTSLDIFEEAGMAALVSKMKLLSSYLIFILEGLDDKIRIITPKNENEHGCQVSFIVKEKGKQLYDWLSANGVSAGWREPEVIRVAPVPLYNSFEDVWQLGNMLETFFKK